MKCLYDKDSMNAERRIRTATMLQVPDRVPVSPLIYYFAASYAGITNYELFQPDKYKRSIDACFFELGPWDAYYFLHVYYPELAAFLVPMKSKEPGFDLPPNSIRQYVEEPIMEVEDYAWLEAACRSNPRLAYLKLFMRLIPRIWEHVGEGWRCRAYVIPRMIHNGILYAREFRTWRKRGVTLLYSIGVEAPFDTFSLARGLRDFARDLRNRPAEVAAAAEALTVPYAHGMKAACRIIGVKRAIIDVHRSSNDFISPRVFAEVSFPSLRSLVETLAEDGITSILHCDGNWDLNLETLRELPAGRVVVQFDGSTDIFRAKEIIGDRMCIYGDVPPSMLVLSPESEVDEYCHRLIEEVGKGGGFILGSGCEVPFNAKPENVRAMLHSVAKYGYYDHVVAPSPG